ncbi:beta-phosphoglucomutase [Mycoplasmopsis mustelae]|uniref:Beta-phosphoglucomutase n=1 Tax=Mycoplasmopsis mustelae TaxID=171289 RepID=A0A4R7UCT8_9BACT|nr:beta-phosphoglucomutase [Mycoplasmopsis mustelae]TDV24209.1 beta-phosphoglucomutase [Mycoplasmopsis mustelae]
MIKGIIFDLDGVLTDTAVLHFQSWQQIVKELGINYTYLENEKLRGLPRLATLQAILKLKKPNLQLSNEQLIQLCDAKNELYQTFLATEINKDSLLPSIMEFLTAAKKKELKLAIASSSYNAPLILKKLGIFDLFDYIVNPADIKNGKPAPDIFIKAAEGIDLKTNECFAIEDAPSGLQAIKSAKMLAIAITHDSNEDFSSADLILNSTAELNLDNILEKFNA